MEVKKNLNNQQRKMLDEIYTEQFKKRENLLLDERQLGLSKLQVKLLKDTTKDKEVKKMLEAGKTFFELHEKLRPVLGSKNVSVTQTVNRVPELAVGGYYGRSYSDDFQEVLEYKEETRRLELRLSEKKREMRARIYGVAATYEEVDADIKELLKEL